MITLDPMTTATLLAYNLLQNWFKSPEILIKDGNDGIIVTGGSPVIQQSIIKYIFNSVAPYLSHPYMKITGAALGIIGLGIFCTRQYNQYQNELKDAQGNTALHQAVSNNDIIQVKTLLNLNTDLSSLARSVIYPSSSINLKNKQGKTPLHLSIENNRVEITAILLDQGAYKYAEDNLGNTPQSLGENHTRNDIKSLFTASRKVAPSA